MHVSDGEVPYPYETDCDVRDHGKVVHLSSALMRYHLTDTHVCVRVPLVPAEEFRVGPEQTPVDDQILPCQSCTSIQAFGRLTHTLVYVELAVASSTHTMKDASAKGRPVCEPVSKVYHYALTSCSPDHEEDVLRDRAEILSSLTLALAWTGRLVKSSR